MKATCSWMDTEVDATRVSDCGNSAEDRLRSPAALEPPAPSSCIKGERPDCSLMRRCRENVSRSWWLFLAALLAVLTQPVAGVYRLNRCYSCMSPLYETLFDQHGLDRYFNMPKNFTSQCDEPMNPTNVDYVTCRTICFTITQDLVVVGHRTGKKLYLRGCAITMFKQGILNHTLAMFDRKDVCRYMNAADLIKHHPHMADSQRVHVCSCLGDRCNASPITSHNSLVVVVILFAAFNFFGLG